MNDKLDNPFINNPTGDKNSIVFSSTIPDKNNVHGTYVVNGDIACDSYNKVDIDVKNLAELGVRIYIIVLREPILFHLFIYAQLKNHFFFFNELSAKKKKKYTSFYVSFYFFVDYVITNLL